MLLERTTEVSWTEFTSYVQNSSPDLPEAGKAKDDEGKTVIFEKIQIAPYGYYGYEKKYDKTAAYYAVGPSGYDIDSSTVEKWESWKIEISYDDPNSGSIWSSVISTLGIVLVCVVFYIIISHSAGGGGKALSFGRTKAKISTNIKVRFADVAGAEEEKEELQEITEFLKNPHKFSDLGARIPKGVLLVGPPGTGKTLFAKAVAGEAGVPFFSVSGSDFVEMYVGVGASRVRDLFEIAKRNQPCIIFIDEIDAVGRERGAGLGGGSDEREQTLNQILVQMDGFEANEAIIVMAATNRSDVLDPALMRPGRFDRKIMVNLPDVKGRESILKVHARNKPLSPDVNFKTVARITSGFSGADLENLLNEAAILAARAGKRLIGNAELYEAINKVEMGPQKKSRVVTETDKRVTAYHESGHAIVSQLCYNNASVHEVTIIPRGNAGGYTAYRPDTDDNFVTKAQLNDRICACLGGRAAEEIVLKDVTQGAVGDLQQCSAIARKMVTEWGMSESLGLVSYGEGKPIFIGRQMGAPQQYSERTAAMIDAEVQKIIEEQHERAIRILTENRSALDNMARLLVERKTIYTEEVLMLIKGASLDEVRKAMDERDKTANENPFTRFEKSKDGDNTDHTDNADNTQAPVEGVEQPTEPEEQTSQKEDQNE
ncbi:MAG: ATP-dependent zinc metalloprotease FtsH [Clostridia bacterium]|nr:ATP-dependent zinc metalloprotease FtsH [Clostridia bacterium]